MRFTQRFAALQIRDRSGHPQHLMAGPGAHSPGAVHPFQKMFRLRPQPAEPFQRALAHAAVKPDSGAVKTRRLSLPGPLYPDTDRGGAFVVPCVLPQLLIAYGSRLGADVKTLHNGPGQTPHVLADLSRRAAAAASVRKITAGTEVHRRAEHKVRRKLVRPAHPADDHPLLLQRLAQNLHRALTKQGELVQKQDAARGQGQLPRPHRPPASGQPLGRNRVMWAAEGPAV